MTAKELQEQAEQIKLEYDGTDDKIQLLALKTWCSIAVSLEQIEMRLRRLTVMQATTLTEAQLKQSVRALDIE